MHGGARCRVTVCEDNRINTRTAIGTPSFEQRGQPLADASGAFGIITRELDQRVDRSVRQIVATRTGSLRIIRGLASEKWRVPSER
jgi:hypothetical protein